LADLPYIQEAQEVKITGQDSTGNTVNYVGADASGNLQVVNASDGSVTAGTIASKAGLMAGQYNASLPTLTATQQVALQVDSSGRLIVAPLTNTSIVKAQLQDNSANGITSTSLSSKQRLDVIVPSNGTIASTAPTVANVAGGIDPTGVLRALQTDSTGNLKISGSTTVSLTNFNYDDMNASTGGIARGTTFVVGTATTLYSFTGAGAIYGFILNLAGLPGNYKLNLIVDGGQVFGTSGITTTDLNSNAVYDIGGVNTDNLGFLGFAFVDKSLRWSTPGGGQVAFNSSVVLKVTQTSGGASKFNAGLIGLVR
jgi:hypothetical protein